MADRAVGELPPASSLKVNDKLVLEQDGAAKSLTGQVLLDFLTAAADGHGGIKTWAIISGPGALEFKLRLVLAQTDAIIDVPMTNGRGITGIRKSRTSGLKDYYTISYNDNTTSELTVTNGKGIKSITKVKTQDLIDTYQIAYNDGTSLQYTVTNGAKGDKGDNTYTWIKFAARDPKDPPHSMGDIPDRWVGFYWGSRSSAPTEWSAYHWYEIKGEKGDTGEPARLESWKTEYQVSSSGTVQPSGPWQEAPPQVPKGRYLWTRTTQVYNSGSPVISYGVSYMGLDGLDGLGTVSNINGKTASPDGRIDLEAADIGACTPEFAKNLGPDFNNRIVLFESREGGDSIGFVYAPETGYVYSIVNNGEGTGSLFNYLTIGECAFTNAFKNADSWQGLLSSVLPVYKGQRIDYDLQAQGYKNIFFLKLEDRSNV